MCTESADVAHTAKRLDHQHLSQNTHMLMASVNKLFSHRCGKLPSENGLNPVYEIVPYIASDYSLGENPLRANLSIHLL